MDVSDPGKKQPIGSQEESLSAVNQAVYVTFTTSPLLSDELQLER